MVCNVVIFQIVFSVSQLASYKRPCGSVVCLLEFNDIVYDCLCYELCTIIKLVVDNIVGCIRFLEMYTICQGLKQSFFSNRLVKVPPVSL